MAPSRAGASPLELGFVAVTGKGGVGKTTVATALAVEAARRGRRVLLCDVDASGSNADLLGVERSGYTPSPVVHHHGLATMEMDSAAAMFHYISTFTPFGAVVRLPGLRRGLELMGRSAPGVREVLVLGRLLWALRDDEYDLVVMDGPATGHVVAHLASPDSVGGLAAGGLLGEQTAWMREMLGDPERSGALVVSLPAPGPIAETHELLQAIAAETDIERTDVVMNRMPEPAGLRADRELVARLAAATPGSLDPGVVELVGRRAAVDRRQAGAAASVRHLRDLRPGLEVWSLPAVESAAHEATSLLDSMVAAMSDEW